MHPDLEALLSRITGAQGDAVVEAPAALAEPLRERLERLGWFVALVDRAPVFGKESLLHALYQSCEFPAHFGFNWDALLDCLSDWEWKPAPGYALLFRDLDLLERRAPEVARSFLEVVRAARAERKTPLRLVRLLPAGR
jgi:RNAse (barnase) inhibitor barstar